MVAVEEIGKVDYNKVYLSFAPLINLLIQT